MSVVWGAVSPQQSTAPVRRMGEEEAFQRWYAKRAKEQGLDPNPDDPRHHYDYRAAFKAGAEPNEEGHWPSEFKREGHPRMVVDGVNTKTGEPVAKTGKPADSDEAIAAWVEKGGAKPGAMPSLELKRGEKAEDKIDKDLFERQNAELEQLFPVYDPTLAEKVAVGAGGGLADIAKFPGLVVQGVEQATGAAPGSIARFVPGLPELTQGGKDLEKLVKGAEDPRFASQDIWSQLARGLGSQGVFLAAGPAKGAVAKGVITSLLGIAQSSVPMYENVYARLREKGVPEAEAQKRAWIAFAAGIPIGASELLGLGNVLAKIDEVYAGSLRRALVKIAGNALEEGLQEFGQTLTQAYAEGKLSKDELKKLRMFQDALEAGGVGAILGGGATGLQQAGAAVFGESEEARSRRTLEESFNRMDRRAAGQGFINAEQRAAGVPEGALPPEQPMAPAQPGGKSIADVSREGAQGEAAFGREEEALPPEGGEMLGRAPTSPEVEAAADAMLAGETVPLEGLTPEVVRRAVEKKHGITPGEPGSATRAEASTSATSQAAEEPAAAASSPGVSTKVEPKRRKLDLKEKDVEAEAELRGITEMAGPGLKKAVEAETDSLTRALNRRGDERVSARLFDYAKAKGKRLVRVAVDLRDLTSINNLFGHDVGDAVIREVVDAWRKIARGKVAIARRGGDEFSATLVVEPGDDMDRLIERVEEASDAALKRHGLDKPLMGRIFGADAGWSEVDLSKPRGVFDKRDVDEEAVAAAGGEHGALEEAQHAADEHATKRKQERVPGKAKLTNEQAAEMRPAARAEREARVRAHEEAQAKAELEARAAQAGGAFGETPAARGETKPARAETKPAKRETKREQPRPAAPTPTPGTEPAGKVGREAGRPASEAQRVERRAPEDSKPFTVVHLGETLNLPSEQAAAVHALARAMGIDTARLRLMKGGEGGAGALHQEATGNWYFSNLVAAIESWPMPRGEVGQFLSHIMKRKGVKEELAWIETNMKPDERARWAAITSGRTVERDAALEIAKRHQVVLREVRRGAKSSEPFAAGEEAEPRTRYGGDPDNVTLSEGHHEYVDPEPDDVDSILTYEARETGNEYTISGRPYMWAAYAPNGDLIAEDDSHRTTGQLESEIEQYEFDNHNTPQEEGGDPPYSEASDVSIRVTNEEQGEVDENAVAERWQYTAGESGNGYEVQVTHGGDWSVHEEGGEIASGLSSRGEALDAIREYEAENYDEIDEDAVHGDQPGSAKYATYVTPGGVNYREFEIILETPGVMGEFQHGHWPEGNVIAFVRMNERTDQNGKKVLFLEEIQSDWHREGRARGYQNDPESAELFAEKKKALEGLLSVLIHERDETRSAPMENTGPQPPTDPGPPPEPPAHLEALAERQRKTLREFYETFHQHSTTQIAIQDQRYGEALGGGLSYDELGDEAKASLADELKRLRSTYQIPDAFTRRGERRTLSHDEQIEWIRRAVNHTETAAEIREEQRIHESAVRQHEADVRKYRLDLARYNEGPKSARAERQAVIDERINTVKSQLQDLRHRTPTPNAPFKGTSWSKMVLKRMLAYAAAEGHDAIAWISGEQTRRRWGGLDSAILGPITWKSYPAAGDAAPVTRIVVGTARDSSTVWVDRDARVVQVGNARFDWMVGRDIGDIITKEFADQLRNLTERTTVKGKYEPPAGTKLGAHWTESLYDKTLRNQANDIGKSLGLRVTEVPIFPDQRGGGDLIIARDGQGYRVVNREGTRTYGEWYATYEQAEAGLKVLQTAEKGQQGIYITEEAREKIKREGFPLFQGERGSVEFTEDGKAIIRGLENPDVSTGIHELAHVARRWLLNHAVPPQERRGITDAMIATAEKWAGVKGGVWTTAAEEKFAGAFERYMRDGKAPNLALKSLFEKFRGWLVSLYRQVTGTGLDVKITPEMRKVFDALVSRGPVEELATAEDAEIENRDPFGRTELPNEVMAFPGSILEDVKAAWAKLMARVARVRNQQATAAGTIPTETWIERNIRRWQDSFRGTKTTQGFIKKQTGEKELHEDLDAYMAEELRRGRTKNRLEQLDRSIIRPLLAALRKAGISPEEAGNFLMARAAPDRNRITIGRDSKVADLRAKFEAEEDADARADIQDEIDARIAELQEQGFGSGYTDEEANAIVEKALASKRGAAFATLATQFDDMVRQVQDSWVRDGLKSQEEVDALREAQPMYAPMRSDLDEDEAGHSSVYLGTGRGVDVRGNEFKAALGRTTKADAKNVLAYAFTQAEQGIVRGEKNRVMLTFLRMIRAYEKVLGAFAKISPSQAKKKLVNGVVRRVYDPKFRLAKNVVAVHENGEQLLIEIDPRWQNVADGLKNLGAENVNKAIGFIGRFTRALAALNTRYNPVFPLFNAMRDAAAIFINSQEHGIAFAARSFRDIPVAMVALARHKDQTPGTGKFDRYAREFLESGAQISYVDLQSFEQKVKDVAKSVAAESRTGSVGSFVRGGREVLRVINEANNVVENGARFSAYVHAREDLGMSPARAASWAKNITVNFERKGEMGSLLNALYMFANAGIQSTARVAQALKHKAVRRLLYSAVLGAAGWDMVMRLIGGKDDDGEDRWDKIPSHIKRHNLVIMLPGTERYITLPTPFVYDWVQTLGQQLSGVMTGNVKVGDAVGELTSAAFETFDPIGSGRLDFTDAKSLLRYATPTTLDWLAEIATNRDWKGDPIVYGDFRKEGAPHSQDQWPEPTRVSKAVAEWLNAHSGGDTFHPGMIDVSPQNIDHFASFWLGGLGRTIGQTYEAAQSIGRGELPALHDQPFISRLVREPSPFQSTEEFRELHTELRRERDLAISEKKLMPGKLGGLWKEANHLDEYRKKQRKEIDKLEGKAKEAAQRELDRTLQKWNARAREALLTTP